MKEFHNMLLLNSKRLLKKCEKFTIRKNYIKLKKINLSNPNLKDIIALNGQIIPRRIY